MVYENEFRASPEVALAKEAPDKCKLIIAKSTVATEQLCMKPNGA